MKEDKLKQKKDKKDPVQPKDPGGEKPAAGKARGAKSAVSSSGSYFSIGNIKKALIAISALSAIYLVTSYLYPWVALENVKLPEPSRATRNEETSDKTKEGPRPFEYYAQVLNQRQLFSNPSGQENTGPQAVASADITKDIGLVGIIAGDNPQAVIEDKKTHRTYYLNKGQSIGDLQVEDIQEGKIIINYNGQKYEMYF